jgi:DNA repair exonuclease SbcCD ATPase subunit
VQARPFTRKQDLRREADKRFRDRYDEFNTQLQTTEQKISELQGPSSEGTMNFSAEQEQELASLLSKRDQLRKDLRKVRFDLNQDIESLGAQLQFLNVIALPGMVLLVGAILLLMRSRSSNARKPVPSSNAS